MRPKKHFSEHKDLVIVCEGSTTEYNYFKEIREFVDKGNFPDCPYTYILILPGETDDNEQTGRPVKSFYGSKNELRYFIKTEQNEKDYKKYKSQPVRYVREAELFLTDPVKPYDEAWAVYDWDVKTDNPDEKKHKDVPPILERNNGKLNVAFSSYSFEEWLLMHFERNNYQFTDSGCTDEHKASCGCGTHPADYQGKDCHGTSCIAGYLREKGYIPTYSKEDKDLFSTYTYPNGAIHKEAFYNVAWLRLRSQRFSADAYTDVDELVCRMIGESKRITWYKKDDCIPYGGSFVMISKNENFMTITNVGKTSCLVKYANLHFTDDPLCEGTGISSMSPVDVVAADEFLIVSTPNDYKYLKIEEGNIIRVVELI